MKYTDRVRAALANIEHSQRRIAELGVVPDWMWSIDYPAQMALEYLEGVAERFRDQQGELETEAMRGAAE